jgi:excisionase family DNA binding protein
MDTNFYTTQQVSEMTGLGVDWIWRQARENKIPHHKAGGRYYRWTAEDIATWTEQTAVKPVKSGVQDLITMGRRRS